MFRFCVNSLVKFTLSIALSLAIITFAWAQSEQRTGYALLLDTSASMAAHSEDPTGSWEIKIVEVKRQLARFLTNLPPGTPVKLYTFDEQLVEGPTIVVDGDEARKELVDFFEKLDPVGEQTYLWQSLDAVLADMEKAANAQPGRPIRLLVYSDGQDTLVQRGGPTVDDVVAKYQDILIKQKVKLTYVTLGFELESKIKTTLEKSNVKVVSSMTADQIIPLTPEFSWTPEKINVGQEVQFVDHTGGVVRDQMMEFGDDQKSDSRSPKHAYVKAGTYKVTLTVTSPSGETQSVTKILRVLEPAAITPEFQVRPESVEPDQLVHFTNLTKGESLSFKWKFEDGTEITDRHATRSFNQPGKPIVTLEVIDQYGRTTKLQKSLSVVLPVLGDVSVTTFPESPMAGESVKFTYDSNVELRSIQWNTSNGETFHEKSPAIKFDNPRDERVEFIGTDVFGREIRKTIDLAILRIPKPAAAFSIPETVDWNEKISLVSQSDGKIDTYRWMVNGLVVSDQRAFEFIAEEFVDYEVTHEVTGPGGTDVFTVTTSVIKPDAPQAQLVVGSATPKQGDQLILTDVTTGHHQRSVLTVNGEQIERDYTADGASRTYEVTLDDSGRYDFTLEAFGIGGSSSTEKSIEVAAKYSAPVAVLSVDPPRGRGTQKIRLINQSEGTINRTVYEFANGEIVEVAGADSLTRTFDPGHHKVKITVYGPEEFTPSTSEVEFDVAAPLPQWVRSLWWSIPSGLIGLTVVGLAGIRVKSFREHANLEKLRGTLMYKLRGGNSLTESVEFAGNRRIETVDVDENAQIVIRCRCDSAGIIYFLELHEDGFLSEAEEIEPGQNVRLGDYDVTYHA